MKRPRLGPIAGDGDTYAYSPPRSMAHVLASVLLFIALSFACVTWDIVGMLVPERQLHGLLCGGVIGLTLGVIGVILYVYHDAKPAPPPQIDPSEEGTATDPDLYNVRD